METMTNEQFAKEIKKAVNINKVIKPGRLNALLDLKFLDCDIEKKSAGFLFEPKQWCLNPYDGVHGGAIASIFDYAGGLLSLVVGRHFVTTTSLATSYLRPMDGEKFRVEVELTHIGRRMSNMIGRIYDMEDYILCATAEINYLITETKAMGLQN